MPTDVFDTVSVAEHYSSVAAMIQSDVAGDNSVGSYAETASYYDAYIGSPDDWAKGGNLYELMDSGANPRPPEDGGSIIHVGAGTLYRRGVFPDKVDATMFGADGQGLPSGVVDNHPMFTAAIAYISNTGRPLHIAKAARPYDVYDQIDFTMTNNPSQTGTAKFTSTELHIIGEIGTGSIPRTFKSTTIRYRGPAGKSLFFISYSVFAAEGHKFKNLTLECEPGSETNTTAIFHKQTGVNGVYPRRQYFEDVGITGFHDGIMFEGDLTTSSPLAYLKSGCDRPRLRSYPANRYRRHPINA